MAQNIPQDSQEYSAILNNKLQLETLSKRLMVTLLAKNQSQTATILNLPAVLSTSGEEQLKTSGP